MSITIDLRNEKGWREKLKKLIPMMVFLSATFGIIVTIILPSPYELMMDGTVIKWMGGGSGAGDVDVYSNVCFQPATNLKYWTDGTYSFPEINFPGSGKLNLSTFWWEMNYTAALVNVTWKNMTVGNVTWVVDSTADVTLLTLGGLTPSQQYGFTRDGSPVSYPTANASGFIEDLECTLGSEHTFSLISSSTNYDFVPSINPADTEKIQFIIEASDFATNNVTPTNQDAETAIIKVDWTDRPPSAVVYMNFSATTIPSDWEIYADPDGTFDDGDTVEWTSADQTTAKVILEAGVTDPEYIWLKMYPHDDESGRTFTVYLWSE